MKISIAEHVRDLVRPLVIALTNVFKAHTSDTANKDHKVKLDQTVDFISTVAPTDSQGKDGDWYIQLINKQ